MVQIEMLEPRIAPATLVSPTVVTYTDIDGDHVTITASKSIFEAATIDKVLKFNTGSVNGSDTAEQQLQLVNLSKIAGSAAGTSLTVSAVQAGGGDGFVNVGYIKAAGIDLGAVVVGGDLGRIVAGNKTGSTPGINGLTVQSIGKLGTSTQEPGGNLATKVRGILTSLNVATDIVGASIGAGDPGHKADGQILQVNIGGSIIGGTTPFSGTVRATGNIGPVNVGGSITGGKGANSGLIGTKGNLSTVTIDGSITGGAGFQSGAVLSTLGMGAVHVKGDVTGGSGARSGQIGTLGSLAGVTIDGSLNGSTGAQSALVLSGENMGDVSLGGSIISTTGEQSAEITSLFGGIGNVDVAGRIVLAEIVAKGSIGAITANSLGLALSGIDHSTFTALTGSIASITANGSGDTREGAPAVLAGDGILASTFTAGGDIGTITAISNSSGFHSDGIADSTFTAKHSIGTVTATTGTSIGDDGIEGSTFLAIGGSIGIVTATGNVDVVNSVFHSAT